MPRPRSLGLLLTATLLLAGCDELPLALDPTRTARRQPERPAPPVLASLAPSSPLARVLPRATTDRRDDEDGFQIKAFYVLPADGPDGADEEALLPASVAAWHGWFADQTGGPTMRLDTYEGALDLTFFRSASSTQVLRREGFDMLAAIDHEVRAAGFDHPRKLHAYYYGGPIDLPEDADEGTAGFSDGEQAIVLLRQLAPDAISRQGQGFGALEWTMAHEIVHALGYVGECAPHRTEGGHVLDDDADLMHPHITEGIIPILDHNRDDYYGHGRDGCPDLAESVFLDPTPDASMSLTAGPDARSDSRDFFRLRGMEPLAP